MISRRFKMMQTIHLESANKCLESLMPSDTRVLVYEYLRDKQGMPVCSDEIAGFYGIREAAVANELNRLVEIRAVRKDGAGAGRGYTLCEDRRLQKIPLIRQLERDLPRFALKLHDGRRLGPQTQERLRHLPLFGITRPGF